MVPKKYEIISVQAEDMTAELFMEGFFNSRVPVLLKGAAQNWDLMKKWSVDYLVQSLGHQDCSVTEDSRPASSEIKTSLAEYFAIHAEKLNTFTYRPIESGEKTLPGVLQDIPLPNFFFSKADITGSAFFYANEGGGTLPHLHRDAFNVLQKGRKHWALYDAAPDAAPEGWKALKTCFRDFPKGSHVKSWFDLGFSNLRQQNVPVLECVQEAGDIVFIPEYFSHAVLNLSDVMGLVVQRSRYPERQYQPNAFKEAFQDIGEESSVRSRHGANV